MSAGTNYLNHEKGLWSWLTTLDHKRIGILYMITVMSFFAVGGIYAMLIRAELFAPGQTIMEPGTYNQVMTFHGAIMVFMVIIPGVPAFLGNFVLPLHLGAKDVAFPRLNLASWYCLLAGAVFWLAERQARQMDVGARNFQNQQFELVDQTGAVRRNVDFAGAPVALFFGYSYCFIIICGAFQPPSF